MEHMKTVEVPATTRTTVDRVTCDLCGAEHREDDNEYGHTRTTVSMDEGKRYPELAYGTKTEFDICVTCFKAKLIPWFEAQGAKPRIVEYGD